MNEMVIRHHLMPRKALYDPKNAKDLPVSLECLLDQRITKANINGNSKFLVISGRILMKEYWTGRTIFICSTDVSNIRRCVKFADDVEIVEIEASGLCLSCAPKPNNPEVVWYDGHAPGSNPKNLIDAIDKALILEGVIELMQANYNAPCGFFCDYYDDNDPIYCGLYCPGCWIDDDETNLDEVPEQIAAPAPAGLRQWIVDTGSEQDLVDTERAVPLQKRINPASTPINLNRLNSKWLNLCRQDCGFLHRSVERGRHSHEMQIVTQSPELSGYR